MREHYVTTEEEGGGELYNRKGGSPVEFIEFTGGDWHPAHPPEVSLSLSTMVDLNNLSPIIYLSTFWSHSP